MARKPQDAGVSLGRALDERMKRDGLSQGDVAALVGVSQSQVNRWLGGARPGPMNEAELARFLGVTEDELAVMARRNRKATPAERLDEHDERLSRIEEKLDQLLARRAGGR